MRTSMRPTTASTTTRATCTSLEHALRTRYFSSTFMCLVFYFHLSFLVFFSFHLLHCELYSELDNLIARGVTTPTTSTPPSQKVDQHWTRRTFFLFVRDFEESDKLSSTHSLYNEKTTEQFNSGCWMIVGKLVWQQEEVRKGDISITLMILEEFFTSVLFKDIQDAISLFLHYRTM